MDGMPPRHLPPAIMPMTRAELDARGIDAPDVVLVTGDAYVDHPSFAMAILGRWLESLGYSVAILAQPDWKSVEPWRALGRPRLFYGVSAGNMDSMINHYTASRKPRSDDAYSPGGRPGLRPDRPTPVYCQRCREAFPACPSSRAGWKPRCAGSRTTTTGPTWCGRRCSCPASATCSCTAWASAPSARSPTGFAAGEDVKGLRDIRGVAYLLGASETPPRRRHRAAELRGCRRAHARRPARLRRGHAHDPPRDESPERAAPDPAPRRPRGRGEPARDAARRAGDGCGLRAALSAHAAPVLHGGHPRRRDDPRLRHDHAGLLRRLHVLLDHDAPGPHHLVALRGLGAARGESPGRIADLQGDGERPRRPDGQHVPDALHEARGGADLPPPVLRAPEGVQAARHRPRPRHRPDAEIPRREGRGPRQYRERDPHGPGPPRSALCPRAGRAPRRGPPEGRAGAHRPHHARADEEAGRGGLRRVRAAVQGCITRRRASRSSTWSPTSSRATPARRWRR